TRANAVRVADVANTSFEITSVSTTTDWYEQAETTPPGYGCKPIVSGIERTGEVTVADPYQCYWFEVQDGESIDLYFHASKSRSAAQRLSADIFSPGTDPRGTSTSDFNEFLDTPPTKKELIQLLQGTGRYRIKVWSFWGVLGTYSVELAYNELAPFDPKKCAASFQVKNVGSNSFSDLTDMDVMASIGTTTMTLLTETSSAIPGLNEWSVTLPATTTVDGIVINNDVYEKGILNTGELLELRVKLAGYASESGTVTVVFPNGVNSTKTFDLLCNN
ncbi:MAG: hypothetical protein VX869_00285, partial [Chloroflexota bacterium]|nr:hypothetical protein [Chloroflexota bacterium]